MIYYNLSTKSKIFLGLGIISFIFIAVLFFWEKSMHRSVVIGSSDSSASTQIMISDSDMVDNHTKPQNSKPLFVSKSDSKKMKENIITILVMFILGLIIYSLANRSNKGQKNE